MFSLSASGEAKEWDSKSFELNYSSSQILNYYFIRIIFLTSVNAPATMR
jgi:hypothetical protein